MAKDKKEPEVTPYDKLPTAAAKIERLREAVVKLAEHTGLSDVLPKGYL